MRPHLSRSFLPWDCSPDCHRDGFVPQRSRLCGSRASGPHGVVRFGYLSRSHGTWSGTSSDIVLGGSADLRICSDVQPRDRAAAVKTG